MKTLGGRNNPKSKIQNLKSQTGRRLVVFPLALLVLAAAIAANAQQASKTHRIGILWLNPLAATSHLVEAFRQGLRDLGYVEGQNIIIEFRSAEGKLERLPDLAAELVRLKVEVIVTGGEAAIRTLKQATQTIPIVMGLTSDPVGLGHVASLARPGGNVTGLTTIAPELAAKRLQLLKEIVPKVSRVALLRNADDPNLAIQLREIEGAARVLDVQLQMLDVRSPDDFESAFQTAIRGGAGAILAPADPLTFSSRTRIVALAAKHRLPGMYVQKEFAEAGGLVAYGPSFVEMYRYAATFVDKILKGTKPADLPVEQPTKFTLVVNLRTAKALGLTVPQSVLILADQVIQ